MVSGSARSTDLQSKIEQRGPSRAPVMSVRAQAPVEAASTRTAWPHHHMSERVEVKALCANPCNSRDFKRAVIYARAISRVPHTCDGLSTKRELCEHCVQMHQTFPHAQRSFVKCKCSTQDDITSKNKWFRSSDKIRTRCVSHHDKLTIFENTTVCEMERRSE